MRLGSDARGMVMVETLLAFIPLFTLFLGVVQYTLLAVAQLVVQHAAVMGARSASVVLDDDPARYGDTPRLVIEGDTYHQAPSEDDLLTVGAALLGGVPELPELPELPSPITSLHSYGPRVVPIRNAVYAKLAAIVPARALGALVGLGGVSVLDALGHSPLLRLAQAPLYLPITTAITFPREPGASALYEDRVDGADLITVRVTHLVTCTIPIAAAIMCQAIDSLREGARSSELERAPGAALQQLLARAGVRAVAIRSEASMPLQIAPYPYVSERTRPP